MTQVNPENYYQGHFFDGEHHPWPAGYLGKIESRLTHAPFLIGNGLCWIVPNPFVPGVPDWVGHEDEIAIYKTTQEGFLTGTWYFVDPVEGCRVWCKNEKTALIWNGTKWVADLAAYPEDYINELRFTWVSASSVQIQVGKCASSDGSELLKLSSPLTMNMPADLDTGSEAASTWYYVWLVRSKTTGAIYAKFSTSYSAPTVTAGDTYRLLGAVRNDASSNFLNFFMCGEGKTRTQYWLEDITSTLIVLSAGSMTSWTPVSLVTLAPPISRRLNINTYCTSQPAAIRPTGTTPPHVYLQANNAYDLEMPCDADQSLDYYVTSPAGRLYIALRGYSFSL